MGRWIIDKYKIDTIDRWIDKWVERWTDGWYRNRRLTDTQR